MAFKKYTLAAFVLAAFSGSALAANTDAGTITFHGLVSGNTCQISLKDDPINTQAATNDFNVTLPTVFVKDFVTGSTDSVDSALGKTPFTLVLSNCDASAKGASAQFDSWSGSSASTSGALVPQSGLQGAASNVNLVLHNAGNGASDLIKIDQTNNTQRVTWDPDNNESGGELVYNVAYMNTGAVSSGVVQAQVAFTMQYQ